MRRVVAEVGARLVRSPLNGSGAPRGEGRCGAGRRGIGRREVGRWAKSWWSGLWGVTLAALFLVQAADAAAQVSERDFAAAEEALHAWDIPAARERAEALRRQLPADPRVAHLLGRVLLHQGDYRGAERLLAEAGATDAPGSFLQVARDTGKITEDYLQAESEHFIFRYPAGKDEILVPYALETLEASYRSVGEATDFEPAEGKILVEVVSNAEELAQVSTLSLEAIKTTGTIAICKFDKLMITSPKALLRGYGWRDTLAHEYIHLVVARKTRNRTPIWLHEGIAKFLETSWRGAPGQALQLPSQALLRDAVQAKKLIPFEKMHPSIALLPTAEDAALAFAEVFTVMEFLHGKDPRNIAKVLEGLRDGLGDRGAVGSLFGGSFPRFERGWKEYLAKREYPKEAASMESLHLKFTADSDAEEPAPKDENKFRDLTELSEFRQIKDAAARRAAHLGELLRARGQIAAAAAKYEEAIARVGAQFPSLSNKYAIALLELEEGAKAEKILLGSLELYPSDPLTNLNLARVKMQIGAHAEAKNFLLQALSTNPFDPEVQGRLAAVAKELGDEPLRRQATQALALLLPGRAPPQPQEQRDE